MGRSPCCDKVGLKKGPWTPEEDQKLLAYIEEHGHGSWRALPPKAGLERCGKSCRLRWTNYLRPDIKRGMFSLQEEQIIIQLHALLGNRWSAIASHLAKRTDNEIKNHWNTHLKKRLTKMGIDPMTHKPKNDVLLSNCEAHSKNASNLSHMAQWESARLEAEARLVRESKLRSHTSSSLQQQLGITCTSSSSSSSPSSTSAPPIIVPSPSSRSLEPTNKSWNNNTVLESPKSSLSVSEAPIMNNMIELVERERVKEEGYECDRHLGEYKDGMDMRHELTITMETTWPISPHHSLRTTVTPLPHHAFTNLLLNSNSRTLSPENGGDGVGDSHNSHGPSTNGAENYWNNILNLVNYSDSPMI